MSSSLHHYITPSSKIAKYRLLNDATHVTVHCCQLAYAKITQKTLKAAANIKR